MSHNPVRAANFYKNNNKRRRTVDAHAGTKHSDIMRRQGVGTSIPGTARYGTGHGFAADVFKGPDFTIRAEILAAGNAIGYGVNVEGDRVYQVMRGQLFITVADGTAKKIVTVQAGGSYVLPRGLAYSVATSTEDVELLIIESTGYRQTWTEESHGIARAFEGSPSVSAGPQAPTETRRRDQSKAKAQAAASAQALNKRRRRPPKAVAAPPTGARRGAITQTGAQKIGRNAAANPNSAAVVGVSPMPTGAGGYKE
jgi:mannose-6-phosphate isomerase-like protein (cupin superfamily)